MINLTPKYRIGEVVKCDPADDGVVVKVRIMGYDIEIRENETRFFYIVEWGWRKEYVVVESEIWR